MIGERVSHLSVSSCVPAPHCTRDSTPRAAHGVPSPAAHCAALPASHCVALSASHCVAPSASPGASPPASHYVPPPAPHCAATPLVWCYLRLTARRISPRCSPRQHGCSPRQHGLPRPYSPRRGDTHAVWCPSPVWCWWCRSVASQLCAGGGDEEL